MYLLAVSYQMNFFQIYCYVPLLDEKLWVQITNATPSPLPLPCPSKAHWCLNTNIKRGNSHVNFALPPVAKYTCFLAYEFLLIIAYTCRQPH